LRELISLPPKLLEVSAYDARLSAAINVGGSNVFHAGDAAATSDPLSGRGWLRALDSAQAAAATASQVLTGSDCDLIKLFRERTVDAFMRHWKVREELKPEFTFD
jgi:flavin-dependent dehydrogenase